MANGFDGSHGWAMTPMTGPMLQQGKELDQAKLDADFYSELRDPKKYTSIKTVEKTVFEGRPCYKVSLVRTDGNEDFEFYDVENGLRAGGIEHARIPDGQGHHDQRRRGLQEIRQHAPGHVDGAEDDGRGAEADVDDRRIRQCRADDLRAAGSDQGADQVTLRWAAPWIVAGGCCGIGDQWNRAGASGRRDVRCRLVDRPRPSFRSGVRRRALERDPR